MNGIYRLRRWNASEFLKFVLLTCFCLLSIITQIRGHNATATDYASVLSYLDGLSSYSTRLSPNYPNKVKVEVAFSLKKILDIINSKQTFKCSGTLFARWVDSRLRWSLTARPVLMVLREAQMLWTPSIVLENGVGPSTDLKPHSNSELLLFHNGTVVYEYETEFAVTCSLNVVTFPIDKQNCKLEFKPNPVSYTFIEITAIDDFKSLVNFHKGSEWTLNHVVTEYRSRFLNFGFVSYNVTMFEFTVYVTREKTYYIFSLFLPCLILTTIIVVPYTLPFNIAQQKVLLPITLILAFNIFLLLMEKLMPKTHEMPLFGQYISAVMLLCTITAFTEAMVVKLHQTPNVFPMPRWQRHLFFEICGYLTFYRKRKTKRKLRLDYESKVKGNEASNSKADGQTGSAGDTQLPSGDHRYCLHTHREELIRTQPWVEAARILDRVGLIVIVLCYLGFILYVISHVFVARQEGEPQK